jgi:hypothetical protein
MIVVYLLAAFGLLWILAGVVLAIYQSKNPPMM